MKVRELYDRIGSEYLGFIPDFSATMREIPEGQLSAFRELGMSEELIRELVTVWKSDGSPFERFGRWGEIARKAGVDDSFIANTMMVYTMFGRQNVESWREIGHQIVHVHGKCYEINEDGEEPNIDYPSILKVLVDCGYSGFISTEWEGHAFSVPGLLDPFDIVTRQHQLIRKSIS